MLTAPVECAAAAASALSQMPGFWASPPTGAGPGDARLLLAGDRHHAADLVGAITP